MALSHGASAEVTGNGHAFAVGNKVRVMVRPQNLALHASAADASGLRGTVLDSMITGSLTKLYVRGRPFAGDEPGSCVVLPDAAAGSQSRRRRAHGSRGSPATPSRCAGAARRDAPCRTAPRAAARPALLGAPLVLLFLVLLVYPVGQLLLLSVYSDGAFTLAKYRQLFASSVYVNVMLITLKISLWTTLLAVVAGYPVAYLISSLAQRRKTSWLFWVLLSFWTSFLVRAFAWIVMLGRNGVVNQLLTALGLRRRPTCSTASAPCSSAWCTRSCRWRC